MMKLSCKDLDPSTTCTYEATGDTAEDVASKMMAHAATDHPEAMAGMSDTDKMSMLESKVHA
jgi:predicted small metal-binding protein